jgi:hypothetical protein
MAQAVSHRRGGLVQSMWGLWWTEWHWDTLISEFLLLSGNITPPWRSILIYHHDEQQRRWGPQFRDIVSPHRHEQQQHGEMQSKVFSI